MINAMIFDLDGTLVQTERLKALSYARAVVELCPHDIREEAALDAFKDVVGLSRREVALALIERFDLETQAAARMSDFGVDTPWEAFVQIRLRYYEELLANPRTLQDNQWPHNVELLHTAHRNGCKTGLATMSYCAQVQRVLDILGLSGEFDFVASRDDVEHGKPDPEIYRLVSTELAVSPQECLVIEDSPSGVKAALAAGMWCVVVTTSFTRDPLRTANLLEGRWIVDDPATLMTVVGDMLVERAQD
jgi:HAD superfamily hydrolase (TIGR01509 family)